MSVNSSFNIKSPKNTLSVSNPNKEEIFEDTKTGIIIDIDLKGISSLTATDAGSLVIVNDTGNGFRLGSLVSAITTAFVNAMASFLSSPLSRSDKNLPALPASVDGDQAVTSGISTTPFSDAMVHVFVNGLAVSVGDGTLTRDCYFSSPTSPLEPKMIANISAGDTLRWNPTVAGYQLSASDSISLLYQ